MCVLGLFVCLCIYVCCWTLRNIFWLWQCWFFWFRFQTCSLVLLWCTYINISYIYVLMKNLSFESEMEQFMREGSGFDNELNTSILNCLQLREDDSHQARVTERHLHTKRWAPAEHRECLQSGQEEEELFPVCHRWACISKNVCLVLLHSLGAFLPLKNISIVSITWENYWTDRLIFHCVYWLSSGCKKEFIPCI